MNVKSAYIGDKSLVEIFQKELQLEEDYVDHLLKTDDWTMMILSWAILEICLNQALIARFETESISQFVERLSIGGKSGKTELAFALELLTREEKKFIDVFSEVRNRFAHGAKRFKSTFDEFFDSLPDSNKFESALLIKQIKHFDGTQGTTFTDGKRALIFGNVVTVCVNISRKTPS